MALDAVIERLAVVQGMVDAVLSLIMLSAAAILPLFLGMALQAGRLAVGSSVQVRSVAFRAVLERRAIVGRVVDAAQADAVRCPSAVRPVPPVAMTFRAGGFTVGSPLKIGPMTGRTILDGLAEIRCMLDPAHGLVMAQFRSPGGTPLTGSQRILQVGATRVSKQPGNGKDEAEGFGPRPGRPRGSRFCSYYSYHIYKISIFKSKKDCQSPFLRRTKNFR